MAARFRLARVLALRTRLREQAEDEVARRAAELAAVRGREAAARRADLEARAAGQSALAGGVAGVDLLAWQAYAAAAEARVDAAVRDVQAATEALTQARDVVRVRRLEERQLERLRERTEARAAVVEARTEMIQQDDLALRQQATRR
jgi:flagellar export protein FliJ